MRLPFISRRRHEDDLAAARAETARLRTQRNKAIKNMETAVFNRERILHQYTDLDEKYTAVSLVNTRLTEDLAAARADASDSLAGQLRAELKREKRRADQLQKQYDNAVGLAGARPVDSSSWQPGYQDPKQATT
jgi:hypothetical protein